MTILPVISPAGACRRESEKAGGVTLHYAQGKKPPLQGDLGFAANRWKGESVIAGTGLPLGYW